MNIVSAGTSISAECDSLYNVSTPTDSYFPRSTVAAKNKPGRSMLNT